MEDSEELAVSEADALGADFITVELDTQPIEYVVKWAEVGSKFTISCVKTEPELRLVDGEEAAIFDQYEEVFPCDVIEQSVEIKTDSDSNEEEEEEEELLVEAGSSQLEVDIDSDQIDYEPEERAYRCSYCGKSYSHASSLYRHQQTHTGAKMAAVTGATPQPMKRAALLEPTHLDAPYTCPHCGMSFKGSRMLGSHLRLHGKRRIHPCNICGKEFNHSSSLSRHRLIHKKGKGPSKEPAAIGPKMSAPGGLGNKMAALRHSSHPLKAGGGRKRKRKQQGNMSAPGDKFYACPQCDMSFRTSTQLSKHQVSHVKRLLDSYTPGKENLSASSDLKIRLKLCSRDKPNFYTLCKKNRRRRGARAARRGPAPNDEVISGRHACSQCGKRFSHASSLARHQLAHRASDSGGGGGGRAKLKQQSGKTYSCALCQKSFMHSSSFSRHKKAHLEEDRRANNATASINRRANNATASIKRRSRAVLDETAPLESDSE